MDTEHRKAAINNTDLYNGIVAHREKFNPLRGLDYAKHIPSKIKIIPPDTIIKEWEKDYKVMKQKYDLWRPVKF